MQHRITLRAVEQELHDAADGGEGPAERDDLLHVEERPFDAEFGDDMVHIGVFAPGEITLHVEHQTHFVGQRQTVLDLARGGRESLGGDPLTGGAHRTQRGDLFTHTVETDFLLERGWIDHECKRIRRNSAPLLSGAERFAAADVQRTFFSESRSARSAAFAALRSALACIFSGLRPKSEKWT